VKVKLSLIWKGICRGVLVIPVLPLLSLFPLAVTLPEKLFLGKASSLSQPHFPLLPQIWEI